MVRDGEVLWLPGDAGAMVINRSSNKKSTLELSVLFFDLCKFFGVGLSEFLFHRVKCFVGLLLSIVGFWVVDVLSLGNFSVSDVG